MKELTDKVITLLEDRNVTRNILSTNCIVEILEGLEKNKCFVPEYGIYKYFNKFYSLLGNNVKSDFYCYYLALILEAQNWQVEKGNKEKLSKKIIDVIDFFSLKDLMLMKEHIDTEIQKTQKVINEFECYHKQNGIRVKLSKGDKLYDELINKHVVHCKVLKYTQEIVVEAIKYKEQTQ